MNSTSRTRLTFYSWIHPSKRTLKFYGTESEPSQPIVLRGKFIAFLTSENFTGIQNSVR